MSPELAERVRILFATALERPAAERSAFLDRTDEDDRVVREVRSLLAAHDAAGSFLGLDEIEGPPAGGPPTEAAADETWTYGFAADEELTGERVGPYEVLRRIGSGGMGEVYLASRADASFQNRVALKLLRPLTGGDPRELTTRFRTERRVLASLDHPNIVHFLDGGTTESGRLYFTMEYVDGLPIDRYVRRNTLSLRARLELFRQICSAVNLAHQNLVVHGDLKPSNILVTPAGVPKLLDFGIAKPLNPGLTAGTLFPTVAGRPLTPEYASPEQLLGEPLTTASDIYSLGALLYQLLSGHRPHELAGLNWSEIERRVLTTTPEPPSVALARGGGDEEPGLASARDRKHLARSLAGDLDNIALMALRKEPRLRYSSAAALSEDLGRYLEGRPVAARQPTLRYRLGKLIHRHRAAVAAGAVIFLLLAGGVVTALIQSLEIRRQRELAEEERTRYLGVVLFLEDLFDTTQSLELEGSQDTAKQILDQGRRLLESGGMPEPSSRAAILETLGTLYRGLGFREEASEVLETSLAAHRRRYGEEHPWTTAVMSRLAAAEIERHRLDRAAELLDRALGIQRRILTEDNPLMGETFHHLGELRLAQRRLDEARSSFEQALAIARRSDPPREIAEAESLRGLAKAAGARGRTDEALGHLAAALEIYRRSEGPAHPRVGTALNDLGTVLRQAGRLDAAQEAYAEALSVLTSALGEHHQAVAAVHNNLAIAFRSSGEYELAEEHYLASLGIYRVLFGEESPGYANCLKNYGVLLRVRGDDERAEAVMRRALEIYRGTEDRENTAWTLFHLAELLQQGRGEPAEALGFARQATEIRREVAPASRELARGLELEAACLFDLDDRAGAVARLEEALGIYQQLDDREQLAPLRFRLANTLIGLGELAAARSHLEHALELLDEGSVGGAAVRLSLGDVGFLEGRHGEARKLYRQAASLYRQLGQPESVATAEVRLAELEVTVGETEAALELARGALETLREKLPVDDFRVADAQGVLGSCLAAVGDLREGERLLLESYRKIRSTQPPGARPHPRPLRRLVAFYEATDQPERVAKYRRLMEREEVPGRVDRR